MKKEPKQRLNIEVNLKKTDQYHVVPSLDNVFFPFEPYPQQLDIVSAIQKSIRNQHNALIESPTGTGKTLCLLVGALSSLIDGSSRKKVYYLTRTHSQISQVVSQFKKTVYSCHLNIIASKEHFCINHNLSKLKGKALQKACDDLCAQKLCTYKEMGNARRPKQALDLQQFKDYCRKQLTCPYFFSKQLTDKTQLTILPFNYLLQWSLFERSSIDLKDSVIIFDEAHNIDSLCEQGSDIRLPLDLLTQTITELKALVRAQNSKTLHAQFKDKYEEKQEVIEFKLQLEMLNNKIKSISQLGLIQRHDLIGKLQEFTTTSRQEGVDLGNFMEFVARGKKITKICYKKELSCENLQLFLITIQKIYQVLSSKEQFGKFTMAMTKTELLFRCLDPSLCFSRILDCKPRSIILSSGTLGDLDLWEKNLQIKFHHKISAQSFITDRHLFAQIRATSKTGTPFNFSFQGKQRQEQFQAVARELSKLERIVKGGIVVAFSTYELLERTLKYCSVLRGKVFFETKGGNIDDVYLQFQKEVEEGTSFLLIVMKGRFSQGINFTGRLCRCLIVVGIPFLPLKDPAVVQKMKYLENQGAGAQQWYTLESFKALNQTIGRAIRNKEDYAVILLFDQRYSKEENLSQLSKWFSRCLRPSQEGYSSIQKFLNEADNPLQLSKAKTSSKNKRELTICDRLAEFSTPNKSKKGKKLKLVLESEEKTEEKAPLQLKEIKITEEEPLRNSITKELEGYFLDLGDIEIDEATVTEGDEAIELETAKKCQSTIMIKVMRSFGKYRHDVDF